MGDIEHRDKERAYREKEIERHKHVSQIYLNYLFTIIGTSRENRKFLGNFSYPRSFRDFFANLASRGCE